VGTSVKLLKNLRLLKPALASRIEELPGLLYDFETAIGELALKSC
jgi:hypothetical protein